MRPERIFRLIVRIFLFILASSMSLVSFLGGYSAAIVLTNEENIDIDVDYEGDFTDLNTFEIEVEFEINNQGYFDLEGLEIDLVLDLEYSRETLEGNITIEETIYEGDKKFSAIPAGEKRKYKITIDKEDFEPVNFSDILKNLDRTQKITFEADELTIEARYSLGLIYFKAEIEDMDLGKYEGKVT